MKSITKAIIFIVSFLVMMSTLPIMQALDNYFLMVADLILCFISAISFIVFLIYWLFPSKKETEAIAKDIEEYCGIEQFGVPPTYAMYD